MINQSQEVYQKICASFANEKAFVVAYYVEGVSVGEICQGVLQLKTYNHLLEIRAFNESKEAKSVFNDETHTFTEPFLKKEKEGQAYVDENMFLLGTAPIVRTEGSGSLLTQGQKTLLLPFAVTQDQADKGIFIKVRNYIDYPKSTEKEDPANTAIDNVSDIAYFANSRYVGFGYYLDDEGEKEEMYHL
jgi:hypothetical protein